VKFDSVDLEKTGHFVTKLGYHCKKIVVFGKKTMQIEN